MSKDNKAFSVQWYPKDILSSARVALMDLKEEGAYRRALDFCWLNGFIPSDEKEISRLIGKGCTVKIAKVVKEMFCVNPENETQLIHDRLDKERVKQQENREKRSKAGKLGNELRWNKNESAINNTSQCDDFAIAKNRLPTPTPTPIPLLSSSPTHEEENSKNGPSIILKEKFPEGYMLKAKAWGVPHEEIHAQLSEFDKHHIGAEFNDEKHIFNSWGIWCSKFKDKKDLNTSKEGKYNRNKQNTENVKSKFNASKSHESYF
jgi:hypothetical protein